MITHHDKAFLAAEDDLRRLPAGDRPDFLQRLRDGWGADFYDLWKSRLAALGRPLEGLQDSGEGLPDPSLEPERKTAAR